MLSIKNIVLYDHASHVVGFVELKNDGDATAIKVKHSLAEGDVLLTINGEVAKDQIAPALNLDAEVLACLVKREGNAVTTLASGIINPVAIAARDFDNGVTSRVVSKSLANLPPIQTILKDTAKTPIQRNIAKSAAAREIDQILRAVCRVDDKNKGVCESCPYRDYFFGERAIEARGDEVLVTRRVGSPSVGI